MPSKSFVREIQVRDLNGNLLSGKHYRKLLDASDDDGRDQIAFDSLELTDGRTAFKNRAGRWEDDDNPSSVFDEIG